MLMMVLRAPTPLKKDSPFITFTGVLLEVVVPFPTHHMLL